MILKDLLPKLSGVRKGGTGFVARCPSHDDKKQSLSLAEDSGRILVKCFAGCSTKQIISSLGLDWTDLFDRRIEKPDRRYLGQGDAKYSEGLGWGHAGMSKKWVHSAYRYTDEAGDLLYENVRYYPKDFKARRFENGREIWNLDYVRRVPYRLPELIEAAKRGQDIFLTEGEKDADTLIELGFAASSFKKWLPEFNDFILGCHIIITQDHDRPGIVQAEEAARILLPAAASIKILDVFKEEEIQPKDGQDISDYVKQCVHSEGLGADELKERISLMVERTDVWRDRSNPRTSNLFLVQSGNQWLTEAKSKPAPKMLFGEFWFEGELCMLFADTNVGKSILAVQAADAISKGEAPKGITVEVPAQKVVYFDFELTSKQFEARFAEKVEGSEHYTNHYQFHPNFYRAEMNPETADLNGFTKFEDYLNHSLDSTIVSTGAKVLIIDNLTYLRDETENARNALPLMKFLKELKSKHGLSILALAHTPKRDSSKPLGRNDLQGSKMIINFCDSAFAIGESVKETSLRFLKQIKARNTEIIYHAENVYLARVVKAGNFLGFHFEDFGYEQTHLKVLTEMEREERISKAKELSEKGLSNRQIAEAIGVSHTAVGRYLRKMKEESGTLPDAPNVPPVSGDQGLEP